MNSENQACSLSCVRPGRKLKVKDTDPAKENWMDMRLRMWAVPTHNTFPQSLAHYTQTFALSVYVREVGEPTHSTSEARSPPVLLPISPLFSFYLYLFPISVLFSSSMWMPSVPSLVLQQKGKYNHGFVIWSMGQSVRTYCRYFLRHVTPCQLERVQWIDAEPRKSEQENSLESDTNVQERADACIMRLPFLILSLLFHPPTIL